IEGADDGGSVELPESEVPQYMDESPVSKDTSSSVAGTVRSDTEEVSDNSGETERKVNATEIKPEQQAEERSEYSLDRGKNLPKIPVDLKALAVKNPGSS
ncbi:MAG TPA: hypothetical protein DCR07_01155, partial [Lactococcus sp.]|nr:hypothetical protein [Lactococcus sp.]